MSLSKRSIVPTSSVNSYIGGHLSHLGDVYSKEENPGGYICLAIAENKLSFNSLHSLLPDKGKGDVSLAGYDDPRGSARVRAAVANLLSRHTSKHVNPEKVCVAAGVSAVLDVLFFNLCDSGDACLIPAPYFSGFMASLASPRVGVVPVPVTHANWMDIGNCLCVSSLEAARKNAVQQGARPRVLLLTNPHNPTGRLYSEAQLCGAVKWARSHGMHVVVDEVYANSVFGDETFKSIIDVVSLQKDVHVVYGFSKDFAVAGWRVGVMYSENAALTVAFSGLAHACEASTLALHTLRGLVTSNALDEYFSKHAHLLRQACERARAVLREAHIPFLTSQAGMFMMLDLREYVGHDCDDWDVWTRVLADINVNLTPGKAMGVPCSGWFRLCFAYESPDTTEVGLRRLHQWLRTLRPELPSSTHMWQCIASDDIPSKKDLHPSFEEALRAQLLASNTNLLDLGCADGRIAMDLSGRGFRVLGVDVNGDAITQAKKMAAERSLDASFEVRDITGMHPGTEKYSTALSQLVVSVVGSSEARRGMLRCAREHLCEGGLLLLSASGFSGDINSEYATVYAKDFAQTKEQHTYLSRDSTGHVLYATHHFEEAELKELVQCCGFEISSFSCETERSSRRPDQVARFFYVIATRAS